ncbi:MAG: 2OG-Fe(II) oxygenase [Spongiibacteraceae bacterium]|jgi:SM-20-related protein|nr:2OG-Fe(II) oxygenase [Spongiibacteraceae bacterium]
MISPSQIADALHTAGWCLVPGYLDASQCDALRADLAAHRDQLRPAGIGRAGNHRRAGEIRRDETLWLTGGTAPQQELLAAMEALRVELNFELQLGLFDYEAHYARYAPGAFYRRHLDAFRGGSNRRLSTVFYLNRDWREDDGGELVLWDAEGRFLAEVLPHDGTALFFLSEIFPHEVLPARRERLSIAGWFRVNSGPLPGMD